MDATFARLGKGRTATIVGRYFAMDRDNRWDRVSSAYNLIVDSTADFHADSAVAGLEAAYARDENDEFVKATRIGEAARVEDGDAVVFMNFRADRARELTRVFVEDDFKDFERARQPKVNYVMLTQYAASIPAPSAFAAGSLKTCWASIWRTTAKPSCASPKPRNTPTSRSFSPAGVKNRSRVKSAF